MLDPQSRSPIPAPGSALNRRRVLAGGARGLLALTLVGAAAACGPSEPPEPDPLEAELAAARRDSELAAAAAGAATPPVAAALNEIAAVRARHAAALVEELARAAGKPTPTDTAESAAASASPGPGDTAAPSTKPAPSPSVREVTDALKKSADSAARLVPNLSGYRAGLMGSIAAACTAAYTVGLPPERRRR